MGRKREREPVSLKTFPFTLGAKTSVQNCVGEVGSISGWEGLRRLHEFVDFYGEPCLARCLNSDFQPKGTPFAVARGKSQRTGKAVVFVADVLGSIAVVIYEIPGDNVALNPSSEMVNPNTEVAG